MVLHRMLILLCCTVVLHAQDVSGLWEVRRAEVGSEMMTPIARWFRLAPDGSLVSGNGGIVHSRGRWEYNPKAGTLQVFNPVLADDFGPFSVWSDGDSMRWSRVEEGQPVTIVLDRVTEVPEASWDRLVGIWRYAGSTGADDGMFVDAGENWFVYFGWDRRFRSGHHPPGFPPWGIWHVHAHRPELRLLSDAGDAADQRWRFTVANDTLRWFELTPDRDTPMSVTFHRIRRFPD